MKFTSFYALAALFAVSSATSPDCGAHVDLKANILDLVEVGAHIALTKRAVVYEQRDIDLDIGAAINLIINLCAQVNIHLGHPDICGPIIAKIRAEIDLLRGCGHPDLIVVLDALLGDLTCILG
ncbi:hypothetical protein DICA1_E15742 [Diutina catenulata]